MSNPGGKTPSENAGVEAMQTRLIPTNKFLTFIMFPLFFL